MPELNLGALQGSALPFYLTVKTFAGDLVPQPSDSPTIEIMYVQETDRIRQVSVQPSLMPTIEPGRYFYVWRIAKEEPTVIHTVILRAILDDNQAVASDTSYITTNLVKVPAFIININVLPNKGVCYPEVMAHTPKCRKHPHITKWQQEEIDIGLDDRAIEGAFRFADFPNAVVDRRVVGKMSFTLGVGGEISSDAPGGGPAQRPGDPATDTKYTSRTKYRYT